MKVTAVKYGDSYFFENWATPNGDPKKRINIIFQVFLIEHDDKMILVDAGCETMPDFEMSNFCGTVKALESKGIKPEDITDVIITHAHHDHIECVKYFKNAVIHIQKDEYEEGKRFIPDGFNVNLFDDGYTLYDSIKILKIGGHSIGSCIVEFSIDGKDCVIVGDECYIKSYFKINTEKAQNENSRRFYQKYSDKRYNLFFSHDEMNDLFLAE